MIWIIWISIFTGMAGLLAYGGADYHQIENGLRDAQGKWKRFW
jgi:hypothetical protein